MSPVWERRRGSLTPKRFSRSAKRYPFSFRKWTLLVFSHVLVSRTWEKPGLHFLKLLATPAGREEPSSLAYREATLLSVGFAPMSPVWERRRGSLTPKEVLAIGQEVSVQLQEMDLTGLLHVLVSRTWEDLVGPFPEATLLSVGFPLLAVRRGSLFSCLPRGYSLSR